jgi:non-homologous end joining protein Ku
MPKSIWNGTISFGLAHVPIKLDSAGSRGKVVEIEEFVPDHAIDPVFFDKTYYVGCRDDG